MIAEYPNLPLIEYKVLTILKDEIKEFQEKSGYRSKPDMKMDVFRQTWPNTAGGFSEPGMFSGQSFINQYTTVVDLIDMNIFVVFFGNEPAYAFRNPGKIFFRDLDERKMDNVGDCYKYAGEKLF